MSSDVREVTYLICTTPRTGSWLLCDGLTQSGLAGYPQEYLLNHTAYDSEWGIPSRATIDAYLEWVREVSSTPNGVGGIKVHWSQMAHLQGLLGLDASGMRRWLTDHLPGLVLLRLTREDTVRQALSYHRALRGQQWWLHAHDAPADETFTPDLPEVARLLTLLRVHDRRWDRLLDGLPVPRLDLTYEQLAGDLAEGVRRSLCAVGCDKANLWPVCSQLVPQLRRQSDARTDLWVHQFLSWQRTTDGAETSLLEEAS